jgi:hypothetical protein
MFKWADAKKWRGDLSSVLKKLVPGLVAGTGTAALVGVLPGLAVGVVFGTVTLIKNWKQSQQPYRLLSHLARKGARSRHLLEVSPA